jgi:hypothetical protein
LPDKEVEPTASTKSCETENVDSCNFRDDASDKVVSCEPLSSNKKMREDVDHISTAQLQSGNCRPAIPATQRTIDIGVNKNDTDVICAENDDFIEDKYDYKHIRAVDLRKGQDRNRTLLLSDDETFCVNNIKTRSMSAQMQLDSNSSIEDVIDYNVNSKSETRSRLNLYNPKDRFLNYILIRYPYVNVEKLIKLQKTDPYFEIIINKCNLATDKTYSSEGKHEITFTIRQEILLRIFKSEDGLNRYQVCCPKIILPDSLLTFHRQPNSIHIGVKKLVDKFSECWYSPDTRSYAMQIIDNCFMCQSNTPIRRRVRGNYLSGLKLTLHGPGLFWHSDCLHISNTPGSRYHSVVTFADGFTGFLIAVPFSGSMTNERFVQIFQDSVLSYFPSTRFIVTDNCNDISGSTTKQALNQLNVFSVNTLPYSPKSNAVENLHRYLLYALKINVQQACLKPEDWFLLLSPSIISLNNTSYYRLKFNLSPQILQTGIKSDFNTTFGVGDPGLLEQEGYEPFAIQLSKSQYVNNYLLTQMRIEKIKQNAETQSPRDNTINPGDLVMKMSRAINYSGRNQKLRPKMTNIFLVLMTTQTSAFIRQYSNQNKLDEIKTFKEFIDRPRNRIRKILNDFHVQKVEVSELKKIKALILTSRESKVFHEHFKIEMPEPPQFMISEGQNFSIGFPLQGGVEILEEDENKGERNDEDIIYENTPTESNSETEINEFVRKPCIRNISNKHISFDKKIHMCDTAGQKSIESLSPIDKGTAVTPHFLPVCRVYKNDKSESN